MPSIPGSFRSSRITSGVSSAALASASSPSAASPVTSMPSWTSSREDISDRPLPEDVIPGFAKLLSRCYAAAIGGRYLWHEFGDVHLLLP
jgi:hypothetical protein